MSGSDPQSGRVQLGVRFAVGSVLDTSTMKSPVNTVSLFASVALLTARVLYGAGAERAKRASEHAFLVIADHIARVLCRRPTSP